MTKLSASLALVTVGLFLPACGASSGSSEAYESSPLSAWTYTIRDFSGEDELGFGCSMKMIIRRGTSDLLGINAVLSVLDGGKENPQRFSQWNIKFNDLVDDKVTKVTRNTSSVFAFVQNGKKNTQYTYTVKLEVRSELNHFSFVDTEMAQLRSENPRLGSNKPIFCKDMIYRGEYGTDTYPL